MISVILRDLPIIVAVPPF